MKRLTIPQMQQHLRRITYRPDWDFVVYPGVWEGDHLAIGAEVENSYQPGEKTTLDVHTFIPPLADEEEFNRFLAWRLARIEVHEMREWLKIDGKPIFDPHGPNADRDL